MAKKTKTKKNTKKKQFQGPKGLCSSTNRAFFVIEDKNETEYEHEIIYGYKKIWNETV